MDPYFDAFMEATEDEQPFAPHRLVEGAELSGGDGQDLRIRVGPCHLEHGASERGLRVSVEDDAFGVALTLDDRGAGFAMGGDNGFALAGKHMWGRTFPRLTARGRLRCAGVEQAVTGTFWLDQQWGEWSYGHPHDLFYHPEWLYYAAVLDDGRSLVIFQAKHPAGNNRAKTIAYIALQDADGSCRYLDDARIAVHDHFESLRTHNDYECGWTVELPEIGGRLEFEPFHHDQEVFVFTRQGGILELGCRLHGRLDGIECAGWGFVEVFGDTLDVNAHFWGRQKNNLARQLERLLPRVADSAWLQRVCQASEPLETDCEALNESIVAPLWSMLDRGGKSWRSAWLTTCYHAYGCGQRDEQVRELLSLIELMHTGSLVIDDIQDDATLRRHRPALHVEIGLDLAINAGCFCYFLPLLVIEELKGVTAAERARMYGIILNALRQGHLGQALDLMWSKGRSDVAAKVDAFETTRAQLVEQYRLKTGCQLEAAARIAGVFAGAPDEMIEVTATYSRVFGVAFQIIDDIIGLEDSFEQLGKEAGEDVHNRKLNIVLLYALSAVDGAERRLWIARLFEAEDPDALGAARSLIEETESIPRCLDYAEAMMEAVWGPMKALPPTSAKIIIRSVPRWLLQQRRAALREARPTA